jgi:drug/metabolite transporter (DMT)-like permease
MATSRVRSAHSATAVGVIAIFLWSCLALLTTLTEGLPPFEVLTLSFGVAFVASLLILGRHGISGFNSWRQPWAVWATGFVGIFVYHALYFFALKAAPAAEASLINYLWPLLLVLLSAFAAAEKLHKRQVFGALLGLAGTAFIMQQRDSDSAAAMPIPGYLAAFGCALIWAGYSVFNRRFKEVPSSIIGGICGMSAVGGLIFHLAFETTVWPDARQWAALVVLGLGPAGLAQPGHVGRAVLPGSADFHSAADRRRAQPRQPAADDPRITDYCRCGHRHFTADGQNTYNTLDRFARIAQQLRTLSNGGSNRSCSWRWHPASMTVR